MLLSISRRSRRFVIALAAPVALLLAACDSRGGASGDGASGGGTIIIAVAADADFLMPALAQQLVSKGIIDQMFEPLALPPASLQTVGDQGYEPRLAKSWSWSADSLQIAFSLDPRARWHDGKPVTAEDVRYSVEVNKDPVVMSRQLAGLSMVDSVSVRDSLTPVLWFSARSPEQFFSVVNNLTVMPSHLLKDIPHDKLRESEYAQRPVGNGRYRLRRWVKGSLIELVADSTNFRGRPRVDRQIWSISPDPATLWARLVAEEADVVEILRGEAVQKVAESKTARLVPYQGFDFGFSMFNNMDPANRRRPHPILSDRGVRRALAMAVDRPTIVKNLFDTLAYVGIGPVVRAQWTADTTIGGLPYDTTGAKRLLDSLGWRDADGNGVREKGGRALAFGIIVPSSSATRRQAAILLQAAWKGIGADVSIEDMEFNTYVTRMEAGKFDVTMHALHPDPSPTDAAATFATPKPPAPWGTNYAAYSNTVVDAAFDSARVEFDAARSKALYHRAYTTIIEDAAAIFLYEPKMVAGIHKRIDPGVLPKAGWWLNLGDWTIAPDQRIARDRIPIGADIQAGRAAGPGDSATST
ncbi:MAG: peptide ABC transporter substrate-binding protein [Gemmatimonadaceae bacterium]|nr:peptide ABC transporter substrate-binding protein [Gemmatimonadaceae bacterium]